MRRRELGRAHLTYAVLRYPEGRLLFSIQDAQPSSEPIIVDLIPPPSDIQGLGDVLLGALGITGFIVVAAVLFGVLTAGVMFWIRSRQSSDEA